VAVARVEAELAEAAARATQTVGTDEAKLFDAHSLMLDDPELLGPAEQAIARDRCPKETAITRAAEAVAARLEALPDEYLRARAADVRDVAARVRTNLGGPQAPTRSSG